MPLKLSLIYNIYLFWRPMHMYSRQENIILFIYLFIVKLATKCQELKSQKDSDIKHGGNKQKVVKRITWHCLEHYQLLYINIFKIPLYK